MGWLTSLFSPFVLNPAVAAAGAGLIAAPILIHLINRMRYRKVRFAAMEFLLASQQKNRRRVLIEQLILLLLRVLIVIGLILLIARLVLDPSALALLRAGAKTHHVVLLDDSGSMRNRVVGSTAFEEAKDIVRKLISEAARESGSQQLTLILLSQAKQNAALVTEADIDDELLNRLDTTLGNLACTHQAFDLSDGLDAARQRLLPERSGARLLHVLSDFRQTDWLDQPKLLNDIGDLGKSDVAVNLVRVAGTDSANLAVTTVAGDLGVASAGIPVRVSVGITNFGASPAENVAVGVTQDRQTLPVAERVPKIEPGDEVFAEFDIAFQTPGRHALRFELNDDALPADDMRHAAVDVAASHPVLIIDGTAGRSDGPGLLADALAPVPGLSGVSPRIAPVDFLRRNPLSEYRAIYMVNVPSLPPDAARLLENYVESGGGLAWFLGDGVQPEFYNAELLTRREGAGETGRRRQRENSPSRTAEQPSNVGLFPVPLATTRRSRELNPLSQALDISFRPVGRFKPFAGELGKYWRGTHVATYLPAAEAWDRDDDRRADGVTTVARLRGGEPIALMHRYGEGRVLTVLTSAGQDWTNWPRQFIYVPFVLESFKELASRDSTIRSRDVGTPLDVRLPAAEFDPEVRIERPDGTAIPIRATPIATSASASDAPLLLEATYLETDEPGIYKVLTAPASGGALREDWHALNAPTAESRLRLADPQVIRKQLTGVANVTLRDPGDLSWLQVREAGRDVRLVLVVVLIALLVGEQALAYRMSYHPPAPLRARFRTA
ncbi:MAG: VWA domain-containing protein [Planctomycetaceae bacterium]|nr:VWA domain-containing protein [Planctomycetaceae bacterium]